MLTLDRVRERLNEIHDVFIGDIPEAEYLEAFENGIRNPCGCDICDLLLDISLAQMNGAEILERDGISGGG